MSDIAITYRSTGPWGVGIGRNLTSAEVDANMYAIAQAYVGLQDDRPEPANISSISVAGRYMTITLSNGTHFGPLPLPVTEFRFRNEWQPLTVYNALDWFTVAGVGIFTVMYDHTSGASFDPLIVAANTLPALKMIFGPDAGSIATVTVYDVEFIYLGHLADIPGPMQFLALRTILVPSADVHLAVIAEAPSTVDQVLPIMHGAGVIGHVTFLVGQNVGTVTVDADETINMGEVLSIGPSASSDSVAALMTVAFAAQRVLTPAA